MRISQITLENFKSFGAKTKIDFAPITLLFGPNSAGKSSLIEALNLISGTEGYSIDEFNELFHYRDDSQASSMSVGVNINLGDYDLIESNSAGDLNDLLELYDESQGEPFYFDFSSFTSEIDELGIEVHFRQHKDRKYIHKYDVLINQQRFFSISSRSSIFPRLDRKLLTQSKDVNWFITNLNLEHQIVEEEIKEFFGILKGIVDSGATEESSFPNIEIVLEDNHLSSAMNLKIHSTNWDPENYQTDLRTSERIIYENFIKLLLRVPFELVENQQESTRRLGPLRVVPQDTFSIEETDDYDGSNAWSFLIERSSFVNKVNRWLNGSSEVVAGISSGYEIELHERGCHTRKKHVYEDTPKWLMKEVLERMLGSDYDEDDIDVTDEFVKEFDTYLEDYLDEKTLEDFKNKHTHAVKFKNIENEHVTGPKNIGVGISQVLPVIVYSIDPDSKFIAIEQPELHLHPRMQSPLADLFIDEALESGDAPKTFLIETHSEHLVLRFRRRIREELLSQTNISVLYIQSEDGASEVFELRLDDEGDFIDRWPQGFFDERLQEIL